MPLEGRHPQLDITGAFRSPAREGRSSSGSTFLHEHPPGGGLAQWLPPVTSRVILTLGFSGSNRNRAFSHPQGRLWGVTRFRELFPGCKPFRIWEFHARSRNWWFAGAAFWLPICSVMKRPARARPKSRRDPVLDPQTADELSRAVTSIVKRLRAGHPVNLPGIGNLLPGKTPRFVKEGGPDGGQETPRTRRRER